MIARDKQLHAIAGAAIAVLLIPWAGPWWALLAVVVVGAAKEAYDATGRGHVELADWAWTVAGWLPVAALWWVA